MNDHAVYLNVVIMPPARLTAIYVSVLSVCPSVTFLSAVITNKPVEG